LPRRELTPLPQQNLSLRQRLLLTLADEKEGEK